MKTSTSTLTVSDKINYLNTNIWTLQFSIRKEEMNENHEWRNICLWQYFWEIRKEEGVVGILCVLLCVFVLSKFNRKIPNFSRCFLHWKSVHRVGGWCLVLQKVLVVVVVVWSDSRVKASLRGQPVSRLCKVAWNEAWIVSLLRQTPRKVRIRRHYSILYNIKRVIFLNYLKSPPVSIRISFSIQKQM